MKSPTERRLVYLERFRAWTLLALLAILVCMTGLRLYTDTQPSSITAPDNLYFAFVIVWIAGDLFFTYRARKKSDLEIRPESNQG